MFYTDEYINTTYPNHQRESCTDYDRLNASVDGSGCHRCNALEFQSFEKFRGDIKFLDLIKNE